MPNHATQLWTAIEQLNVPYIREDSFKLCSAGLLTDRWLVGIDIRDVAPELFFGLARQFGMPVAAEHELQPYMALVDTVCFSVEPQQDGTVIKIYFEFWQAAYQEMRKQPRPMLLHFGVKWHTARQDFYQLARYTWVPYASLSRIMQRVEQLYQSEAVSCAGWVNQILQRGACQLPEAPVMYLEASEHQGARASFDLNVYQYQFKLGDVADLLRDLAAFFTVDASKIDAQLLKLADCPLGHLSGGLDRTGRPFFSVYARSKIVTKQGIS